MRELNRRMNLSGEIGLLLACGRAQVDPTCTCDVVALVASGLDWERVLSLAEWHGMLPVLFRQAQGLGGLPAEIGDRLARLFEANTVAMLGRAGELVRLVEQFERERIPVLAFKGPVLAQQLYGQLGLRQAGDLDLLIRETELTRARRLLEGKGYVAQFALSPDEERRYVRMRNEHAFRHPERGIMVELHWALCPLGFSFTPHPDLAWVSPGSVEMAGRPVGTLSLENQVLFLCAHHSKHGWASLGWVCDLALLLQRERELDWSVIRARAGVLGTERMVRVGLLLAGGLFGVCVSEGLDGWVREDAQAVRLAERIRGVLCSGEPTSLTGWGGSRVYLATMELLRDRFWFGWDTVVTPTPLEWSVVRLPGWLLWLYYPIRAGRLVWKHTIRRWFPVELW